MTPLKLGILSIVLAALAVAAAAAMVRYTLRAYNEHGNSADQAKLQADQRAAGRAAWISTGLAAVGAVAGGAGLLRAGRGKATAVAGVVLCGTLLSFFALILAIQLTAR